MQTGLKIYLLIIYLPLSFLHLCSCLGKAMWSAQLLLSVLAENSAWRTQRKLSSSSWIFGHSAERWRFSRGRRRAVYMLIWICWFKTVKLHTGFGGGCVIRVPVLANLKTCDQVLPTDDVCNSYEEQLDVKDSLVCWTILARSLADTDISNKPQMNLQISPRRLDDICSSQFCVLFIYFYLLCQKWEKKNKLWTASTKFLF